MRPRASSPRPRAGRPASVDDGDQFGDSPVEVREKVHRSTPMTLSDALSQMELVGHDFYLFHDIETDRASVVYRRHGWSYGVLHLDLDGSLADGAEQGDGRRCRGRGFLRGLSGSALGSVAPDLRRCARALVTM